MRYGAVPIGSRVGGLIDTIIDAGSADRIAPGANGLLFDGETPADMVAAVDRAFDIFARADAWQTMQRNGMGADYGWRVPAGQYADMYAEICAPSVRALFSLPKPAAPLPIATCKVA
jgi:starch synthase